MELAIVAAVITFFGVGVVTTMVVLHQTQGPVGFFVGAVAAVWVSGPLFKAWLAERDEIKQPPIKRYKVPWTLAFAKVRDILATKYYRRGTVHWNVDTADTQAKRIHATMRFTDEEETLDSSRGNIGTRTEYLQRFVEVDILFAGEDENCSIQLTFNVEIEGPLSYRATDEFVEDLKQSIEVELGPGTAAPRPPKPLFETPSWLLLGVTASVLLVYSLGVWQMLAAK